jgi:hypothetical protein
MAAKQFCTTPVQPTGVQHGDSMFVNIKINALKNMKKS